MSGLVDQEARDLARYALDTSVFLEAGAGTGKTTVLVDRVLNILLSGRAAIHELAVITFTEKAAGDLRSRIRERLYEKLTGGQEPDRAQAEAALGSLDAAHIETIHAFASRLLREHPFESGIDPNFTQLDGATAQLDFLERWQNWLWSLGEGGFATLQRALRAGLTLERVQKIAEVLSTNRDALSMIAPPTGPAPRLTLATVQALLSEGEKDAASCTNPDDRCLGSYMTVADQVGKIAVLPDDELEAALLEVAFKPAPGAQKNWRDREALTRMRATLEGVADELKAYTSAILETITADVRRALAGFVASAARERLRDGLLTFEDLLIEARRMLRENESVRHRLQARFKFMLVDEFQDTDPLQAEMVFRIAADPRSEASASSWQELDLVPGKLLLVGDPKQSIYRFRRADIEAYAGAKSVFERILRTGGPAAIASLVQNFRSVHSIVSWVNGVFAQVIQKGPGYPNAQPDYARIEAHREDVGERVMHLYPRSDLTAVKIDHARKAEAIAIAKFINALVYRHRPDAEKVAYGDICILVDTRTKIEIYTEALTRHGIPYILDGGTEFFQRQEVRDIAAVLRALDDPSDQVSLVAALKSEAFSCSDEELLAYKVAGGRFNLFAQPIDGDPVSAAISRLRTLFEAKPHLSLPAFADQVVRATLLMEGRLLGESERQRASNLKLIVQRAIDFASRDMDSLRPFIRWVSTQQNISARENESQLNETDEDVVRIMTIHGAKGLEFKVVVMAKLASGESGDQGRFVVDRDAESVEFEVGSTDLRFRTPGFERAWGKEAVYADAEARRKLYVAATRARDYLILPVYVPEAAPGLHALLPMVPMWEQVVKQNQQVALVGARVLVDDEIPARSVALPERPSFPEDVVPQWQARVQAVQDRLAEAPRFVVPSELSRDELKQPRETEPAERSEAENDPDLASETDRALSTSQGADTLLFAGSTLAAQRGSLVHEVLYRCDLADPAGVDEWARKLCAARGAPGLIEEVATHARRVLLSDSMRRVLAARRYLREVPVAIFQNNTYVEGFVDLLFEEADGWVVVDYKTDALGHGGTTALVDRYRPQLEAYTEVLVGADVRVKEWGVWLTSTGDLLVRTRDPDIVVRPAI